MLLPELDRDHLSVFVFGPGVGELIVVRAPPGAWMIIDGCVAGDVGYAQRVLDHYRARPAIVALTHPHDDHSAGLLDVIDRATPYADKAMWPRIGMVLPPALGAAGNLDNAATLDAGGITERVIGAVEARWSDHPPCRWYMDRGSALALGEARVQVVAPEPTQRSRLLAKWRTTRRLTANDKNRLSTVLHVEWQDRRIVLGSDLIEKPGRGWSSCVEHAPLVADHEMLKVPHHGSSDALLDSVLRPGTRVPEPLRVIAPYRPSGLPRFSPGEGIARVHQHAGVTYLTGLPRAYAEQSGKPEARRLADLRDHDALPFSPTTSGFPDCYLLVSFPPDESPPRVVQGSGSMLVLR